MPTYQLTFEQVKQAERIRDEVLALATSPLDWPKAVEATKAIYKELGVDLPEEKIIYVASPLAACVFISMLSDDSAPQFIQVFKEAFTTCRSLLKKKSLLDKSLLQRELSLDPTLEDLRSLEGVYSNDYHRLLANIITLGIQQSEVSTAKAPSIDELREKNAATFLHHQIAWDIAKVLKRNVSDVMEGLGFPEDFSDYFAEACTVPFTRAVLNHISSRLSENLSMEFWQRKVAWYRVAQITGIEVDAEKVDFLEKIVNNTAWLFVYSEMCVVSDRQIAYNWSGNFLHNENGPALEFADGYALYYIDGVQVNSQIVMAPETITLEQIKAETNEEVRRIMITRYGWGKYIEQTRAELLDSRIAGSSNKISTWMETLVYIPNEDVNVLCTYDPSTGRPYHLPVENSCRTCEEAQTFLLGADVWENDFGVEVKSSTPVVRT